MARNIDKEATARMQCRQRHIAITETQTGALHFMGHGIDFKVATWQDLNLSDLTAPSLFVERKRRAREGCTT
jgi:hypothetical protein